MFFIVVYRKQKHKKTHSVVCPQMRALFIRRAPTNKLAHTPLACLASATEAPESNFGPCQQYNHSQSFINDHTAITHRCNAIIACAID